MDANKSFLKIWLLSVYFEKFASLNEDATNHSGAFGGLWMVAVLVYRGEFFKVNGQRANF